MKLQKLKELEPGKRINTRVRVLESPQEKEIDGKKVMSVLVGDETNLAQLVAWGKEAKRWDLEKDYVLKINSGQCPKSHAKKHRAPTIIITSKSTLEREDPRIEFPKEKKCLKKRFLDELEDYRYGVIEGLIVQVYDTVVYFCSKCQKFSEKTCVCGSSAREIFKIRGLFSDSTATKYFSTSKESTAEAISEIGKERAKDLQPSNIMNEVYSLLAYERENKIYVERII